MKRKMLLLLLCLALLCVPMLQAQANEYGSWYYEVRNGGVVILNYRGDSYGHVEIPATIDGHPVTGIENSAFMGRKLSSVTIPDTVTKIADATFAHCPNLTTVNISKNVTMIESAAFMDCESLTGIWVDPQNPAYTNDSQGVLYTKDKMTLVQVPGSIQGTYVIPDGVFEIGDSAFQGCSGLTEVIIAESVQAIGGYAFYDCSNLTRLTIPADVEIIGGNAFTRCVRLTGIDVAEGNRFFSSDESGNLYNKDKTTILYVPSAFVGDYVLPQGLTEIGPDFFEDCDGLTSVTIPEGVTKIGHYAFYSCDNLKQVSIAESVSDIGSYTFQHCEKLTTVNIPEQVTHIRWGLFRGCESLTQLPVHDKVKTIDDYAFAECHGLTDIVIPASVEYVGHYAFRECKGLRNVYFCGDAPKFVNYQNINGSFAETKATAYYHKDTNGWTEENMSKTGGQITWVELEHIVFDEGPDARCVVCGEIAEKNTAIDGIVPGDQENGGSTSEGPGLETDTPTDHAPPKEENPKTADMITDIAGIFLILMAIGLVVLTKQSKERLSSDDDR